MGWFFNLCCRTSVRTFNLNSPDLELTLSKKELRFAYFVKLFVLAFSCKWWICILTIDIRRPQNIHQDRKVVRRDKAKKTIRNELLNLYSGLYYKRFDNTFANLWRYYIVVVKSITVWQYIRKLMEILYRRRKAYVRTQRVFLNCFFILETF